MTLPTSNQQRATSNYDERTKDREAPPAAGNDVERLNEVADELNRETEDVLEYQTLS